MPIQFIQRPGPYLAHRYMKLFGDQVKLNVSLYFCREGTEDRM